MQNDNKTLSNQWTLNTVLAPYLINDLVPIIEEYVEEDEKFIYNFVLNNKINGEKLHNQYSAYMPLCFNSIEPYLVRDVISLINQYSAENTEVDKLLAQILNFINEVCSGSMTLIPYYLLNTLQQALESVQNNQKTFSSKFHIPLQKWLKPGLELYAIDMIIFLMTAPLFQYDKTYLSLIEYCRRMESLYRKEYENTLKYGDPQKNLLNQKTYRLFGNQSQKIVNHFQKEVPDFLNNLKRTKLLQIIDSKPKQSSNLSLLWSWVIHQDRQETMAKLSNKINSVCLNDVAGVNFLKDYILGLGDKLSEKIREQLLSELATFLQSIDGPQTSTSCFNP